MNDRELDHVLKRARVPERDAGYWDGFPGRVAAELERRRRAGPAVQSGGASVRGSSEPAGIGSLASLFRLLGSKPAFAVGFAVVCLAVGFFVGFWKEHGSPGTDAQVAQMRKYYRELEALFPNQLQAIVFDQKGAHMVLANEPDVPASAPLYVKICGPKGCQRFVTFSGQEIRINGDTCEVLADGRGGVLLVGEKLLWAGPKSARTSRQYSIEAKPLEATL